VCAPTPLRWPGLVSVSACCSLISCALYSTPLPFPSAATQYTLCYSPTLKLCFKFCTWHSCSHALSVSLSLARSFWLSVRVDVAPILMLFALCLCCCSCRCRCSSASFSIFLFFSQCSVSAFALHKFQAPFVPVL